MYYKRKLRKKQSRLATNSDHLYGILIIGGAESGKINALLILVVHQPDIDKIYLYAKDPYETKYQLLTNKRKGVAVTLFKMGGAKRPPLPVFSL